MGLMVLVLLSITLSAGGDSALAEQLRRLDAKQFDRPARLDALEWLHRNVRNAEADQALPALERCLRTDPEAEVRRKAAEVLGLLAFQSPRKLCPLALVEALLDPDEDVHAIASVYVSMYKEYPPGSVDVLLRCARLERPCARGNALLLLARAGGKDEKVLQVLRQATADKHLRPRTDAHIALFNVTNQLDDLVPYLLRMRIELREEPPLGPNATEQEKTERVEKNLTQIGAIVRLLHFTETRTDEMARLLVQLTRHNSPVMRRSVADFLEAFAKNVAWLQDPKEPDPPAIILPDFKEMLNPTGRPRETREEQARRLGKVVARLRSLKLDTALAHLQKNDPDAVVRAAAESALRQLAAVKGE
jgi:HEAT repeat protein